MVPTKQKKILFIAPYPKGIGPSQRFRFEHYLPHLKEHSFAYDYQTFISEKDYPFFYRKGRYLKKTLIVIKGFAKRFSLLFNAFKYDFIFIQREATPIAPPFFEWFLGKVLGKKLIYDFDDAIWVPQTSEANPLAALIKCNWKVAAICKWSWKISVGNRFLSSFAEKYNRNVFIIPTVVDTENMHNPIAYPGQNRGKTIGWTGTFTNFANLSMIVSVLQRLDKEERASILVIADRDPEIKNLRYQFQKWNKETEIKDLLQFDIGLMPLLDEEFQKGKCGFKAIQYMALGIPAVVSPVGVNSEIVNDGLNGYWATTEDEWYSKLRELLDNNSKRVKFGKGARKKIVSDYSVQSTLKPFLDLFKD